MPAIPDAYAVDERGAEDVNPLILRSYRGASGHLRTPLAFQFPKVHASFAYCGRV